MCPLTPPGTFSSSNAGVSTLSGVTADAPSMDTRIHALHLKNDRVMVVTQQRTDPTMAVPIEMDACHIVTLTGQHCA